MPRDPRAAYDELPPLPPKAVIATERVLYQAIAAASALGELKSGGSLIPDQTILINSIPLQEAKSSSEIENIVTTQDELFRAAAGETRATDPQVKEILRYRTALRRAYDAMTAGGEPLSLDLIRMICSTLLDKPVEFRPPDRRVYVGNAVDGAVIYTPPRGGPGLFEKMRNLESFLLGEAGPHPLLRMAIAHYQFEAIHPFSDGNGRTGRILNILYLVHAGLLSIPVLYLSRYVIQNKAKYYRLLRSVTEEGAWEPWLLYMLRGVEETALLTTARIQSIRDLLNETVERCRRELPKVYSKELIELIFRQPYCKIKFVVDAGIAQRETASLYLQALEQIGILVGEKRGREIIYKHPALVDVLTA